MPGIFMARSEAPCGVCQILPLLHAMSSKQSGLKECSCAEVVDDGSEGDANGNFFNVEPTPRPLQVCSWMNVLANQFILKHVSNA